MELKRLAVIGLLCVWLGGCFAPINRSAEVAPGPSTERIVTTEDALLQCYAVTPWSRNAPVNVAAAKVTNATGKVMYGDYGTGSMLPLDSGSTVAQALILAKNPKLAVSDRLDLSVLEAEIRLGLRGQQNVVGVMPAIDAHITGDTAGLDALGGAAAQIAIHGYGGGPRQERWEVQLNLRIVNTKTMTIIHSVSVKRQYVQEELAAFVGTTLNIKGKQGLLTADVEGIRRTLLQGLVRQLIYPASAELIGHLKGAPAGCLRDAEDYLNANTVREVPGQIVVSAKN